MGLFRRVKKSEPSVPFSELEEIHARRFPDSDKAQFVRLWCDVAKILGKPPTELHEDEPLTTRVPTELFLDDKMEDLVALALRESRGTPKGQVMTVGALLDFLLGSD